MTHAADASRAYHQAQRATADSRVIEQQLFSRVTGALTLAARRRKSDHPAYIAALSANLELWTALAADVASEGNGLPAPLRRQIFALAKFTIAMTSRLLGGDETAEAQALIDVNLGVLRGLRREPA